jgi:AraC-like DNA-binding protein
MRRDTERGGAQRAGRGQSAALGGAALSRTGYAPGASTSTHTPTDPPGDGGGGVPATLVLWGARALYVGSALGLGAHRNAVAVVAVGLDALFGVARDPGAVALATLTTPTAERGPGGRDASRRDTVRWCRTALIPPCTLHRLHPGSGRLAFLYLDALGVDLRRVLARARDDDVCDGARRAAYDLAGEADLVTLLDAAARGRRSWAATCVSLGAWLRGSAATAAASGVDRAAVAAAAEGDAAVAAAVRRMRDDPAGCPPLATLAATAGVSPSRFAHRFTAATGVPFRRYRTWCRMAAVARAASAGATLTRAALDAGFASSAHLSAAFRAMFGLSPTQLGLGTPVGGRLALVELDEACTTVRA